jgi:hypothetical protein
MPYIPPEEELAYRKQQYYDRAHEENPMTTSQRVKHFFGDKSQDPTGDPQSYMSSILQYFGADDPYRNDSGSYDYRAKKTEQQANSQNPDFNWMIPEIPDEDQRENATNLFLNGRADDPRSPEEKNQAALLNATTWPLLYGNDEVFAGAMSILPGGGSYDEELAKARRIQDRQQEYGAPLGWRDLPMAAGNLFGALPLVGLTGAIPKATTMAGKAARYAAAPAAGAAEFGAYDFNDGRGGFQSRLEGVRPENVVAGAIVGGMMGHTPAKQKPKEGSEMKLGGRMTGAVRGAAVREAKPRIPRGDRPHGAPSTPDDSFFKPMDPSIPTPRPKKPMPSMSDLSIRQTIERALNNPMPRRRK